MSDHLDKYFQALQRLKSGRTIRVPKGTRISLDSVSLEAGLGKGTIKKSRAIFAELISTINHEKNEKIGPVQEINRKLALVKSKSVVLQTQLDAALGREISLLREVYKLKKELSRLVNRPVTPIRGRTISVK